VDVINIVWLKRDQAIRRWCRENAVIWTETQQYAVQRGHWGRRGWTEFADDFFKQPLKHPQLNQLKALELQTTHQAFAFKCRQLPSSWLGSDNHYQPGGERAAKSELNSFLTERLGQYCFHISKPDTSRVFSSRLSAYLAYGNLSLRSVLHTLKTQPTSRHQRAFYSRIRWHCHFVQKFESDCRIEFEPLNPAYQALLEEQQASLNPVQQADYFAAWASGNTGYPLVDACMRALLNSGFVNFRMRAMLVSMACHHLQLDWKAVALHLTRHFLDFDPGIHYPQIQMQAGLTGFNTLRIYNPVQQSLKQDADASYIREFVPELSGYPVPLQHQPWLITPMEALMFAELTPGYANPIIDIKETGRAARERLWRWRNSEDVKANVSWLLNTQVVKHA
jgi:deoxyribodipyrimidine photo-lyase